MSKINLETYSLELEDRDFTKGIQNAKKQVHEFRGEMNKLSSFLKGSVVSSLAKTGDSAQKLKKVLKTLEITTHETTNQLNKMKQSLMNMSHNSKEQFVFISAGMNHIRQSAEQVNKEYEKTIQMGLKMKNILGNQVKNSMEGINSMVDNMGKSSSHVYDTMIDGADNSMNQNSKLLDTLKQYMSKFASSGFNVNTFTAMIVEGANNIGALNIALSALITKFVMLNATRISSFFSTLVLSIQRVGLQMTLLSARTTAAVVATTALKASLTFGLSLAVLAVIGSIKSYNDRLEENKRKQEETKIASDNLKTSIKQFKENLDTQAIENVRLKLDELAETMGYADAVSRKAKLTKQLDDPNGRGIASGIHISKEIKQLDKIIKEYEAIKKSTIDELKSQYKGDTLPIGDLTPKLNAVKQQVQELKKLNQVENKTAYQQKYLAALTHELRRNLIALGISEKDVQTVISATGGLYSNNIHVLDEYMTTINKIIKDKKLKHIEELKDERNKHEAIKKMLAEELGLRQKINNVFSKDKEDEKVNPLGITVSPFKSLRISPYKNMEDESLLESLYQKEEEIDEIDKEINTLMKELETKSTSPEVSYNPGIDLKKIEKKQNKYQSHLDNIAESQHTINLLKAQANSLDDEENPQQKIDLLTKTHEELGKEKKYLEKLNIARREELKTLEVGADAYRELQDEIRNTSLEWWNLDEEQRQIIESTQAINESVEALTKNKLRKIADAESKIVEIYQREGEKKLEKLKEDHENELKELEEHHDKKQRKYDEDLENYKKHIQSQIDALNQTSDKEDYEKTLEEKQEKLNEIQMKINELSLVTGDNQSAREALIEKAELKSELKQKQQEIDEYIAERNKTLKIEALEESLNDFEEHIENQKDIANTEFEHKKQLLSQELQKKTEKLETEYSKEALYSKARKVLLSGEYEELTTMFMDYQKKTGEGWSALGDTIRDEFVEALHEALEAVEELKEKGIDVDIDPDDSDKGSTKKKSHTTLGGGFEEMTNHDFQAYKQNKGIYEYGNNPDAAARAAKENQELRDRYKIKRDDYSYDDLKNYYHEGGWVTSFKNRLFNNLRSDEVPAVLQTGEFVLSRDMITKINSKNNATIQQPNVITIGNLMAFHGNIDNSAKPMIQTVAENSLKKLENMLEKNGCHTEIKGLRI